MKAKEILVIMLVALALAACTLAPAKEKNDQSLITTSVEDQLLTQTTVEQSAQEGTSEKSADYPAKEACEQLNVLLGQQIGLDVEMDPASFTDMENGVDGAGCQLTVGGSGEQITDWGLKTSNFVNAMDAAGWKTDNNFSGGGAGTELLTVRRDENVCMYTAEVRPEDPSLCRSDEPLAVCLDRLNPSYIIYEITISCTPDSYVPPEVDPGPTEDEKAAIRITFDPGAISQYVNGELESSSSQRYVLTAMEGQEMVVSLSSSPPLNGLVVIYGFDGTVLISDHASTAFWSGILPSTQDYYISVHSSPYYAIAYTLQVIIPPVGELYTGAFQPMSFTACEGLADLVSSAMGVEAQISFGLFTDHVSGLAGTGCKVTSWGTWNQFPDRSATSTVLRNSLSANGWVEDQQYAGGGAGGFMTGFISGDSLCLYTELVSEMDPWVCKAFDGPITNCWDAQDETGMYFEIELNCASVN